MSVILRDLACSGGEFPVACNEEILGGFHPIESIDSVDDEIPDYVRKEGMIAFDESTEIFYKLTDGVFKSLGKIGSESSFIIDLSAFTSEPKMVRYGYYRFYGVSSLRLRVPVPYNCEMSILNLNKIDGTVMTPISGYDWNYNTDGYILTVDFNGETIAKGEMLIGFYA